MDLKFTKESFANCWTFFTAADPTHGYVEYVSQEEATELGLYKVKNGAVWMGTWAEEEGLMMVKMGMYVLPSRNLR